MLFQTSNSGISQKLIHLPSGISSNKMIEEAKMRRSFLVTLMLVMTAFFVTQTASAQFKIPKFPKPKPQPTPTETTQPASTTDSESEQPQPATQPASSGASAGAGGPYAVQPQPPMATPQFLPETLEIQVQHWDYYWK